MSSDLERFLQQAAERLAKKVREASQPPQQNQPGQQPPRRLEPQQPRSIRDAERQPRSLDSDALESDIVDAEIVESPSLSQRQPRRPKASNIESRPGLAQEISLSDERMAGHVREVFDHEVTKLRKASPALDANIKGETEKSIDLQRRQLDASPLVSMLRQPDSLRAAFIASEIFKRKF